METDMPRDFGLELTRIARFTAAIATAIALLGGGPGRAAEDSVEETPPPRQLPDGSWKVDLVSPLYVVDREYRSMTGPWSTRSVQLGRPDEVFWVLGYSAVMAGPDGSTPASQEFMCHSNLDFDPSRHQQAFGGSKSLTTRLFTLSQGQLEISFPAGFGMPLLGDEPLSLTTQALNLNPTGESVGVRHRVSIHYAKQSQLTTPMKPLFTKGVYGLQLLEGENGYFGIESPKEESHGPGCLQGQNAANHVFSDGQGRKFTGHWVVKPGREENRTLVTKILELPYDTTIHYIAVHLHPFAESLELRDLTTGQSVFKSSTRPFPDRIGLAHVDSFSSVEGIPIYKDHEYELVSVYQNITDQDQDSMAVMNLYMLDKDFVAPTLEPISQPDDGSGPPAVAADHAATAGPAAAAEPADEVNGAAAAPSDAAPKL
jgi:hypothetical protein